VLPGAGVVTRSGTAPPGSGGAGAPSHLEYNVKTSWIVVAAAVVAVAAGGGMRAGAEDMSGAKAKADRIALARSGAPAAIGKNARVMDMDADGKLVQVLGKAEAGRGEGVFDRPEGVEIRAGEVWFSDTYNDRIVRYAAKPRVVQ